MPALIGLGLALAVAAFGRIVGMDRDRAFYPVILIVVAHYYILFAAIGGASEIPVQLGIFGLFAAVAVLAFRQNLLGSGVVGLAGHGVFGVFHRSIGRVRACRPGGRRLPRLRRGRGGLPGASAHHRGSPDWWALTGSNRRPSRCKRDALPTELSARGDFVPRVRAPRKPG